MPCGSPSRAPPFHHSHRNAHDADLRLGYSSTRVQMLAPSQPISSGIKTDHFGPPLPALRWSPDYDAALPCEYHQGRLTIRRAAVAGSTPSSAHLAASSQAPARFKRQYDLRRRTRVRVHRLRLQLIGGVRVGQGAKLRWRAEAIPDQAKFAYAPRGASLSAISRRSSCTPPSMSHMVASEACSLPRPAALLTLRRVCKPE